MRSAGSLELRSVFFGFLDVSSFPLSPPRPRKTHALAQSDLTQMHPIGFLSSFYCGRCGVRLAFTLLVARPRHTLTARRLARGWWTGVEWRRTSTV